MMKRFWLIVVLLGLLCGTAGCSGVIMNAKYSQLLDEAVAVSDITAEMAARGALEPGQMVGSLQKQADLWKKFQDARDGRDSEDSK